ncbi:MAG: recombinase family protein [Actinobacteria bacterium]|nr:recombinase family protein [Actinomycetota bacterium]
MNSIIYIRVSTTEQAEFGYSLKAQEEICLDYAKRNKYEVLKIFIEKGESAKTTNRTELKNMLSYVRSNKNKIDALIIYKMDRLSRDIYDSLTIRLMLKKLYIDLKSVTEPFDDSPFGTFTATLFSSIAQLDNDIRSERTVLGMKQAIKEGRWLWNAPLGYKYKYVNQKSYLIPSEDADTIRKIFKYFIDGKKQYEICEEFKKSGIKVSKQHLNNILRNPLYIGKLKTKLSDELIDGVHEHLIDDVTFYKAQNILSPNKNHYNIKYTDEFPLKRFLKCPECNRHLAGSYSKGRYKRYAYYHCVTKGCLYKPAKREIAEALFIDYLDSFSIKEDIIEDVFEKIRASLSDKEKDNINTLKSIRKEITLLEDKKAKIEELVIDGTFSKDTYHKKINEVETEILTKKIQLNDCEENSLNIDEIIDLGKRILLNLSGLWVNMSIDKKRKLQDSLFPEGIYLENNEFRTTEISSVLKVIEDKNYCQSIMAWGERIRTTNKLLLNELI